MTTITAKAKKTNDLGLKKDIKKVTPANPTVEKKTETAKEVSKTSSQESEKAEGTKKVQKPFFDFPAPAIAPELSLEQKIEKVENLKILIEKREILEESRKKLNAFVVGSPQFGESIKLTDENDNVFQTSNTEVFTKVIATIKETLIEKIAEIETDIKF